MAWADLRTFHVGQCDQHTARPHDEAFASVLLCALVDNIIEGARDVLLCCDTADGVMSEAISSVVVSLRRNG